MLDVMTSPIFIPPWSPSPGSGEKPEVSILKADFGEGYTQATRQMNNVRRVLTLKWDVLDATDRDQIINFMALRGGTEPFLYTPTGETTAILFTAEEWSSQRAAANWHSVSVTLRQSFVLV